MQSKNRIRVRHILDEAGEACEHFGDALDKLDKTAGVNSRGLWIATTQTR